MKVTLAWPNDVYMIVVQANWCCTGLEWMDSECSFN